MELHDIVLKLVGNINPAGDASIDDERFENLKKLTNLIDDLISDVQYVSRNRDSYESSVKRSGVYADEFYRKFIQ